MKSDILEKFSNIKIFLFDLEGVLIPKTFDGSKEEEEKLFEKLKYGCQQFTNLNVKFGIVTAGENELVKKIKLEGSCMILSDSLDKVTMVDDLLSKHGIDYANVFYMGDDLFDIPLLKKAGLSSTPGDGRREVKRIVSFTAKSNSGEVLEEIIDYCKESKKVN